MPITDVQFVAAAKSGDLSIVDQALNEYSTIPQEVAQNAFVAAAEAGQVEILDYLFQHKDKTKLNIKVNDRGLQTGETALFAATIHNKKEAVEFLLTKAKASPNTTTDLGYTPLMAAAKNGEDEIAKLLIKQSGNKTTLISYQVEPALPQNEEKHQKSEAELKTALMYAAMSGHADVIKTLLSQFPPSDKSLLLNLQDKDGYTALMYAANYGHANIVKVLIENGADLSIQDYSDKHRQAQDFVPDDRLDMRDIFVVPKAQEEKSPAARSLTLEEVTRELEEYEDPFSLELPDNPILVDKKFYDIESINLLIGAGKPIPHNQQPFPENFLQTMQVDENAKTRIAELKDLKEKIEAKQASQPSVVDEVKNVTIHTPVVKEVQDRFRASSPGRVSQLGQFANRAGNAHEVKEIKIEKTFQSFKDTTVAICSDYMRKFDLDAEQGKFISENAIRERNMAALLLRDLNNPDKANGRRDVMDLLKKYLDDNWQKVPMPKEQNIGDLDKRLDAHAKALKAVFEQAPRQRH